MEIQVKARCIVRRGERVLLEERRDALTGEIVYRPPGGNVEPGETSRSAVVREFLEECGVEIRDLRLLGVLEDIRGAGDRGSHQIQFIYEGTVGDEAFYRRPAIEVREGTRTYAARWMPLAGTGGTSPPPVLPEGLMSLVLAASGEGPEGAGS